MVPVDAVFLAAPFVPGVADNVLRHADDVGDARRVLVVGEGNFEYSLKLHEWHPEYRITATGYDLPENLPPDSRNFAVIREAVDARTLSTNPRLSGKQFDAVIFNNPHAGDLTQSLTEEFVSQARPLLAPGGEINIHLTNAARTKYKTFANIADARHVGTFGPEVVRHIPPSGFPYYAPYVPRRTNGRVFRHYWNDPNKSWKLERWVIPGR